LLNQFDRELGKSFFPSFCGSILDGDILTIYVTEAPHRLQEFSWRLEPGKQIANPSNTRRLLLGVRGRAMRKEDQAAHKPHAIFPHTSFSAFLWHSALCPLLTACCHLITRSALASTLGGILTILDFGF
jgi:hypothetical protein